VRVTEGKAGIEGGGPIDSRFSRGGSMNFLTSGRASLSCKGRVVLMGMANLDWWGGKLLHIASTGNSSFFIHPRRGINGDLGCWRKRTSSVHF